MNATAPKFLKKIAPSTVTPLLSPPIDLVKIGETRPVAPRVLYHLFGRVSRVKTGSSTMGEWVRFMGDWRVVDPSSGEIIGAGPGAHIPGVVSDMIYSQLDEARARDPKAIIEVALKVGIVPAKPGKPSATGYEYDVQPLLQMEARSDDPMAQLMARARQNALPAPEATVVADEKKSNKK